ncbi:hypothetical protein ABPG77_009907 [Micractinium sp. CCAP 211/92]
MAHPAKHAPLCCLLLVSLGLLAAMPPSLPGSTPQLMVFQMTVEGRLAARHVLHPLTSPPLLLPRASGMRLPATVCTTGIPCCVLSAGPSYLVLPQPGIPGATL